MIGFVDPVRRGNYGSRFSHSCAPNAVSVSMGVLGKYNIAVCTCCAASWARRRRRRRSSKDMKRNKVQPSQKTYNAIASSGAYMLLSADASLTAARSLVRAHG